MWCGGVVCMGVKGVCGGWSCVWGVRVCVGVECVCGGEGVYW